MGDSIAMKREIFSEVKNFSASWRTSMGVNQKPNPVRHRLRQYSKTRDKKLSSELEFSASCF
jgi:tRNA A37 threonylcarbamoyladenosine dehydratase